MSRTPLEYANNIARSAERLHELDRRPGPIVRVHDPTALREAAQEVHQATQGLTPPRRRRP